MSIIAIAVKHLMAAGVTGDALVTVIAEMEAAQIPIKSKGAIRQERFRERNKSSQSVTYVTSVTKDSPLVPPSDGFPHPSLTPPYNPPIKILPKTSKSRGTRLTADWDIPHGWGEWAEQQGLTIKEINFEADKFRDFWVSKAGAGGSKADWEATWRNWIRKYLENKDYGIQKHFKR